MHIRATIYEPIYALENQRRYMRVSLDDETAARVRLIQDKNAYKLRNSVVNDPLIGRTLILKVPFRYRRVMCEVRGSKGLLSLVKGDELSLEIEYCGTWNLGESCGHAWKILSAFTGDEKQE